MTTLEPCCMCLGAAIQSTLTRLYFAGRDPYGGAAGLLIDTPQARRRPLKVIGPLEDGRGGFAELLHLRWLLDFPARPTRSSPSVVGPRRISTSSPFAPGRRSSSPSSRTLASRCRRPWSRPRNSYRLRFARSDRRIQQHAPCRTGRTRRPRQRAAHWMRSDQNPHLDGGQLVDCAAGQEKVSSHRNRDAVLRGVHLAGGRPARGGPPPRQRVRGCGYAPPLGGAAGRLR